MKKLTIAALMAVCAGLAAAENTNTVVMPNGDSAVVLQQKGTSTDYVKSLKLIAEQGTVFSGVQIVKMGDGTCAKVESTLIAMPTFKTEIGTIQTPQMDSKVEKVACPS